LRGLLKVARVSVAAGAARLDVRGLWCLGRLESRPGLRSSKIEESW
jgi:hypothetical protein